MKKQRSLIALAAALLAGSAAAPAGRHIRLAEDDKPTPGLVRFLSQAITLADGATQSWVTVTRAGDFSDPRYGNFSITLSMLQQMVRNFDARVVGQDIFLDVAHRHSDGAAAKVLKLAVEGSKLRALVEWTPFGIQAVKDRGFAYLSAEYHEAFEDPETKKQHGCTLLAAGLTTRPVIKRLDPIQLSADDADHDAPARTAISPSLLRELQEQHVNYLDQLKAKYKALGLSDDVATKLLAEAKKQFDAAASDQVKSLALVDTWAAAGQSVLDQLKALGQGNPAQPTPQNVTITLATPQTDVAAAVQKALADRDTAAADAQTKLQGRLTLLSDTLKADLKELAEPEIKALADAVAPLITVASTDDQVKALAGLQVRQVQQLSAQAKLQGLGYVEIAGSARIAVDSSNSIKSLQETVDKRLGYTGMSEAVRFEKTGGKLLAANKEFAEKALAAFDREHGHKLDAEHKMLAGGVGSVADVKVPVVAERTVLREALYQLTSLNLVNVGTAPFANVITVPFSYRDVTAAGVSALRRYEGQGIRRAGVIQTQEEARPLPQKLAYLVSSELKLLMSASPIDWDPVAENVRNIVRIVAEDTEALNYNELVFSADEAVLADLNDVLTAQVNGNNTVFVTTKFPVVRPRTMYDIQGNQVGATVNPLTVTLNGVARAPYVLPADGSALANGLYYVMDWNLGELRFVDQTGAVVAPTNGWVLSVVGKASTNRSLFDTDAVNGETVRQRYDRLLTAIGSRKVVVENDRFYTANVAIMSGALDNALTQAESFTASGARTATGLGPDGSVGITKGVPTFNPRAPGLVMGDTRIMVGERGNTRFRMVKPFSMTEQQQVRNAQGLFTDQQEAFGTQWVVSHTPTPLKNSLTSIIVYSAGARVARVA
ncbi:phage I-like protein [Pseudacidovorax intermedius]|uniref:Phage I-like protein n=1 Tax=Pseudacidovorax intermedius TaxID=433924 RepID=A0A370FGS1_9BURK|nr:phage protease [Pseudacidovorax intermedius]RDI25163.1 phage I-like protein [Pseudacidovorax intermedius]